MVKALLSAIKICWNRYACKL